MSKSYLSMRVRIHLLNQFEGSDVLVKSIPRYITLAMGLAIYGLMLKVFSSTFFSAVIIAYSISGILLWFADFGSSNLMLLQNGDDNLEGLRYEWTGKLLRIFSLGAFAFIYLQFFQNNLLLSILVIVCLLDLDSDTALGLRQLIYTLKSAALIQVLKKGFQLISLICWDWFNWTESPLLFALVFLLPVVLVKIIDTKQIGGLRFQGNESLFRNSFTMWLQGGFSPISNLDLVFLSFFGSEELIVSLAIAKKIISSLYILSSTLSAETMGSKVIESDSPDLLTKSKAVRSVLFLSAFLSFLLIFFLNFVLSLLGISQDGSISTPVLVASISLVPFNVLGSYYNALLLKGRKVFLAGCQGYISVLTYLLLIAVFGVSNQLEKGIVVSIVCRVLLELLIGKMFIKHVSGSTTI